MEITEIYTGDELRFVPVEVVTIGKPVRAIDSLRLSENLTQIYGVILRETLAVRQDLIGNQNGRVVIDDAFAFLDRLSRAQAAILADGVGIAVSDQLQRAASIIEKLGILEQLGGGGTYHITLVQGIKLVTKLAAFFGFDVVDGLGLSDADFARVMAFARADDEVAVGEDIAPQLLMSVKLADGVDITPEQLVNMIYQPTLLEGVEFEAGYLAPDGSFTTWVMNTRSAAVTEYADYAFNSFASIGSRYYGASADGLFQLDGDTDDGEDIIARIVGGYLQFGGTQLSRLKEAYIAADGGGFVLRIRTADGLVYNYRTDARSGRSTKIHMGKGQRSRYFAFELLSEGQDFDLDTLEFVPLVMQRRV
jgi:hypothetical protein